MVDDMKLNQDQARALNASSSTMSSAIFGRNYRWDSKEMPYVIDKSINSTERRRNIEDAISSLNKLNCGCFYIRYLCQKVQSQLKSIELFLKGLPMKMIQM